MNDYKQVIGENLGKILKAKGWTETDLAEKTGVTIITIHRQIQGEGISFRNVFAYIEALGCGVEDLMGGVVDENKFEPVCDIYGLFPYNLILDALNGNKEEMDKLYLPGFYAMYDLLREAEKSILDLYYKQHMTLKKIGEKYGKTIEGIRQIKLKALRKLACRKRLYIIDSWKILNENNKLKSENLELRLENTNLPMCRRNPESTLLDDFLIDELGLSVRSRNALIRGGYKYISELSGKSKKDIMSLRCVGQKSCIEIVDKLKEHGVELS